MYAFSLILACLYIGQSTGHLDFLILHNNDLRARMGEDTNEFGDSYGGFARISHIVKEARLAASQSRGPPVIYLYAGDTYTGPVWRNRLGTNLAVEFLNILRPDVACFGQHELDRLTEVVHPFVEKVKFPLVAANIHFPNNSYLSNKVRRSVTLRLSNGAGNVGVIGYVASGLSYLLPSDNEIRFEDEITAIRRECERLKGADAVIALGYAGFVTDKKIAERVDCIDAVVGGLTHPLEGSYPTVVVRKPSGKRVPVVQTYGFAKYVGKLRLRFNDSFELVSFDGNPIFLNEQVPEDDVVAGTFLNYKPALRQIQEDDVVLGQSIVPISSNGSARSECNMANFVTDTMLEFAIANDYMKASSFAIINCGALKGDINTDRSKPNITRKMLEEVISCYDPLVHVRCLGSTIKEAIEAGVSNDDGNSFIHAAGMRFDLDLNAPPGQKVKSVRTVCIIAEEPRFCHIEGKEYYHFITTRFFLSHGGHENLRLASTSVQLDQELMDAFIYVFDTFGAIRPEYDNRIFYRTKGPKSKSTSVRAVTLLHSIILMIYAVDVLKTKTISYNIDTD